MSAWDRTTIQALLDRSPKAVLRGIVAIHALQTGSEQACHATIERNGIGFSKFDAEPMTDLARRINNGHSLSPGQFAMGRNRIKRYWRQLAAIANESGKPVAPALMGNAVPTQAQNAARDLDARLGSWGK